jgi:hypothetical protein
LTLDPEWVKIRIRIRDEQPGLYFLVLKNNFLGLKYLNLVTRIGIRDGKIRIRDKHHGSATLLQRWHVIENSQNNRNHVLYYFFLFDGKIRILETQKHPVQELATTVPGSQ